jgi:hypothetical protein
MPRAEARGASLNAVVNGHPGTPRFYLST